MHKTTWILLDTEMTGLAAPIFVVELAAQRMRGWSAEIKELNGEVAVGIS